MNIKIKPLDYIVRPVKKTFINGVVENGACGSCGNKASFVRISEEKGRGIFIGFECKKCSKDMSKNWKKYTEEAGG